MKTILTILVLVGLLSGCSTMTIHPKPHSKLISKPTYQTTVPFYFWGLSGVKRVNVKQVCGEKEVVQMQTQATIEDSFFTLITLGIYSPHTVKVWCE